MRVYSAHQPSRLTAAGRSYPRSIAAHRTRQRRNPRVELQGITRLLGSGAKPKLATRDSGFEQLICLAYSLWLSYLLAA